MHSLSATGPVDAGNWRRRLHIDLGLHMINRIVFFDGYRQAFGKIRQSQADGITVTLNFIDRWPWASIEETAYYLATKKHECADTWWPIEERGPVSYFNKYEPSTDIGRKLGNTMTGDGYLFRGRGDVMLTGRGNYAWAAKVTGFPLIAYPDGMRWPELAYRVTQIGMQTGAFTGRKLSDFPGDYVQMRRVVNGLDRAQLIAGYAEGFERILKEAA